MELHGLRLVFKHAHIAADAAADGVESADGGTGAGAGAGAGAAGHGSDGVRGSSDDDAGLAGMTALTALFWWMVSCVQVDVHGSRLRFVAAERVESGGGARAEYGLSLIHI
eukprot:4015250-Pleurochrysis_carterae.AAC.2